MQESFGVRDSFECGDYGDYTRHFLGGVEDSAFEAALESLPGSVQGLRVDHQVRHGVLVEFRKACEVLGLEVVD